KLTSLQRKSNIRICSAYRTISSEGVGVIAGVPPIEFLIKERKEKYGGLDGKTARANLLERWQAKWRNGKKISLEKYKLDPAHYYTAPGLSWDSMLKLTEIELELLTDIDIIHFFKKGIRGGISQCSERKHIANNRFLPNYDANEPTSFISYLDATNFHGLVVTHIHRALKFKQSRWMKKYIDLNTDLRNKATNKFEKNQFKLMTNSVF
ncbi:hypothetical protein NQ317_006550, partial [Molorchus minor]